MATPAAPLPGETPEQRRARLSAAYAVQARIDAQRQAELEAQEEARRKEMQARIDNMLRSAYVLPPLPQLPVPEMAAPKMAPSIAPMIGNGPLRPTQAQIDAYYATGRGGVWDSVRGVFTTSPYDRAPPLPPLPPPTPIPTYYDPVPPVMPPVMPPVDIVENIRLPTPPTMMEPRPPLMMEPLPPPPMQKIYEPQRPPMMPPVDPGFVIDIPTFRPPMQPPMPVDPGFVMDIPTFQPPVPEIPNVGLIDNRIGPGFGKPMQPTPSPIDNMSSSILDALRQLQPSAPGNTDYGQPAQPSAGMGLSRLAPEPYTPPVFEPYTPPMAEPYTPPSMQFSVDMPRMDYARDLYGVIPDNVSMLKRGGLAVKPKKGKC
jgi:hypothetical protein